MQTPEELTVEEKQMSDAIIQRPDTPVVFANVCNMILTPEDARMVFGIRERDIQGKPESVVTVFTTLYALKRWSTSLATLIERYEEDFGNIEVDFSKRLIKGVEQDTREEVRDEQV